MRRSNVRLNILRHSAEPEVELIRSERFRIFQYLPIIDTFLNALDQRISAYEETELRFGFFIRI